MLVCGLMFAGFERVAEAAGPGAPSELHDAHDLHAEFGHDDDGEEAHAHFCHCTVHGAALLLELAELNFSKADCSRRPYRIQTSSRGDPPPLRPPNT